jgi:hypothetical protein
MERTKMQVLIRLCAVGVLVAAQLGRAFSAEDDAHLASVTLKPVKTVVGELVKSDETGVTLKDLKTGAETHYPKKDIVKLTDPITIEDAARTAGLPAVFAWQLAQLSGKQAPTGKVIRVTPTAIYVNLGKGQVSQDQELDVFRVKEEIKDPDTGEVLARERPRIAKVKVTEVQEKLCKVRIAGELEVSLEIGDEVTSGDGEFKIAVCPSAHESGELTDTGVQLAEDLTTLLVQQGATVVERSELDKVLGELLVQNTILFEAKSAQELGKLTGATVVVVGKIVPSGKAGKAYMRLVDVQSGEILQAASASISLANSKVVKSATPAAPSDEPTTDTPSSEPANAPAAEPAAKNVAGGRKKLGTGRSLPPFLRTKASYKRHKDGGVVLADRTLVFSKEGTYLNKDFTLELIVALAEGDQIAFIGVGQGEPPVGAGEPGQAINLRFHAPDLSNGEVMLAKNGNVISGLGSAPRPGTHLVRIVKEGESVTFSIDVDNDGPTDDDMESTISNIKEAAPFLNSKNMFVFFGGSGRFLEISLK